MSNGLDLDQDDVLSRSTFCWSRFGSKLFEKVISRQQKSQLTRKELNLCILTVWISKPGFFTLISKKYVLAKRLFSKHHSKCFHVNASKILSFAV